MRKITQRLLTLLFFLFPPAFAQKIVPSAEQTLLQIENRRRAEHNLPSLVIDAALSRAAHAHANLMVRYPAPALHQYPGEPDLIKRAALAGAHFGSVAENVAGEGYDITSLESAWINSPVHRANILDPHVNVVGIAVVESNGKLYAVEDFASSVPVLGRDEVEDRVQQLLRDHGIGPATSSESKADARKSCETQTATGNSILVMQWDGPDLNQLPNALLQQQMPQARDHTAAVGACPTTRTGQGFTTYRIAVLMY